MPSGFFLKEKPPRTLFARARLLWFRSKTPAYQPVPFNSEDFSALISRVIRKRATPQMRSGPFPDAGARNLS